MMSNGIFVDEFAQVIAQSTGPALLLGAVAAFVSALNTRLSRVADHRTAMLDSSAGGSDARAGALTRRAILLSKAIKNAVISGIFTTGVVIVSFISAAVGLSHAYGGALLFVLALGFFAASLICLWLEVRSAISGPDAFL